MVQNEIKIAIITPIYYDPYVLNKFLNKINKQTKKEQLVIYLINDCSPVPEQNYQNIIQQYNLDIVYLKTKINSGPGVARQLALDQCKEDYIFFMDEDDYLYNNQTIEIFLSYIEKKDYHIIMIDKLWIYEKDNQIIKKDKGGRGTIDGIGGLFKKTFLQQYHIGYTPECSFYFEDSFLINQINFYLLQEPLVSYLFIPNYYYVVYHSNKLNSLTYKEKFFQNVYFLQAEIIYVATLLEFYEQNKNKLNSNDIEAIRKILSNYYSGSEYILSFIELNGFNSKINIQTLHDKWLYIIGLVNKNKNVIWKTGYFDYLKPYLKEKIFSINNNWQYFCQSFEERFNKINGN